MGRRGREFSSAKNAGTRYSVAPMRSALCGVRALHIVGLESLEQRLE